MNKILLVIVLSSRAFSQTIEPQLVEREKVPEVLTLNVTKFIDIMNGKSLDKMETLFFPSNKIVPAYKVPENCIGEKRPEQDEATEANAVEAKRFYRVHDDHYLIIYGLKDIPVIELSTTSAWIKGGNGWYLMDYGLSMKDLIQKMNIDAQEKAKREEKK
jgi:hypothetical protein